MRSILDFKSTGLGSGAKNIKGYLKVKKHKVRKTIKHKKSSVKRNTVKKVSAKKVKPEKIKVRVNNKIVAHPARHSYKWNKKGDSIYYD